MSSKYASMVVLPEAEYLELQQRQKVSTTTTPLEKKYDKVLHQYREHSKIHDPIEQHYKQGEDLDEMRRLRDKMNAYYFKNENHKDHGSQLLSILSPALLDCNHAGEILDKQKNQIVRGSRLDDLIIHAVSHHRPSLPPPPGWNEFVSILKRAPHIPEHILNARTQQQLSSPPASTPASPSPSVVFSPPPPKVTKRKSEAPTNLHGPRTRLKAKRSRDAHEVAESLLSSKSPLHKF